jgi:hypothetical protein
MIISSHPAATTASGNGLAPTADHRSHCFRLNRARVPRNREPRCCCFGHGIRNLSSWFGGGRRQRMRLRGIPSTQSLRQCALSH